MNNNKSLYRTVVKNSSAYYSRIPTLRWQRTYVRPIHIFICTSVQCSTYVRMLNLEFGIWN